VPEGYLIEITCRTIQSRLLLQPTDELEDITVGILGRTQEETGMRIHGYSFQSNHFHLLLSPDDAFQLARFMCLLNSNLAREVGRLHGWRDRVWGRRYQAIAIENAEDAQVGRLRYLLAQGCKEGLVASPREWPGASSVNALLTGSAAVGTWIDRTRAYRARRKGIAVARHAFTTQHRVVLSPLPCWRHLSPPEHQRRVEELVAEIEAETAIELRARGRKAVGAASVRRQHPLARPLKTKRSPAPAFHTTTRAARTRLWEAYRAFVDAYRRAADRLARGDLAAEFPPWCFPPPLPFVRGPAIAGAAG